MKLKSWIVWLLAVIFLVSEALLFTANHDRNVLNDSLRDARQQVVDLQAQMDQLKSSMAAAQNAELSKLRADNQDLPRLRNQVTQLQAANQKLALQLKSTLTAAQQAQVQAQRLAVENQQVRAVAQQLDAEAARNACINNLQRIEAAKQEWALENNKGVNAIPTTQDLLPYIVGEIFPVCPAGGTYTIGAVSELPACSIPGHVMP